MPQLTPLLHLFQLNCRWSATPLRVSAEHGVLRSLYESQLTVPASAGAPTVASMSATAGKMLPTSVLIFMISYCQSCKRVHQLLGPSPNRERLRNDGVDVTSTLAQSHHGKFLRVGELASALQNLGRDATETRCPYECDALSVHFSGDLDIAVHWCASAVATYWTKFAAGIEGFKEHHRTIACAAFG